MIKKQAKLFAEYGASLPKNDPPKGDKEAFEKLAKAYESNAKSLEKSADKSDLKGAQVGLQQDLDLVHDLPQEPPAELNDAAPRGRRTRAYRANRVAARWIRFPGGIRSMQLPLISQKAARFPRA